MKNAKKILAVLSAAVMLFSFAACKGGDDNTTTAAPETTAVTDAATTAAGVEETTAVEDTSAEETTAVEETSAEETTVADETTAAATTAAASDPTTKAAATTKAAETTTKEEKATAPTSKADIVKLFNDASAKVVSAKPGFTKKTVTTVPSLEMGALAKIKIVRTTVADFLGEGTSTVTVAKGKSNSGQYVKSTLSAGDVTNATAKLSADGKTYDVTITVKNETNPIKGKSALGRFTNDYKDANEIKKGLDEAGVKLSSLTMKSTSVVIKAQIDAATGQFKSLNYNIKQSAEMTDVQYTIAKVAKATGKVVNDVTFSGFKY